MKIAIFTGPRVISAADAQLVRGVVRQIIAGEFQVYVGDATGTDFTVAQECFVIARETSNENIFAKRFFPRADLGRTPAGLAERSTRMVKEALRDAGGDELLCVGFPNKPCPAGIVPAKYWKTANRVIRNGMDWCEVPKSGGSGTWSTIAICAGHRIYTNIFPIGKNGFIRIAHDAYDEFGYFYRIESDHFLGKFYGFEWRPYENEQSNIFEVQS